MPSALLKASYAVLVAVVILVVLEFAARAMGVGDPILYYNAAWGGMRPLPDQQVTRLRGATVTIDANGFRSAHAPAPGARRVLYIGDSVTWGGTSIDDTHIFTEIAADVLREQGKPVYAMNAGVNGTGLVNHAELFQNYQGEVDALVWLFPWGDVERVYAVAGLLLPAQYKPRFALVEVVDQLIFRLWIPSLREGPEPTDAFTVPEGPPGYERFYQQVIAEREEKNLSALRDGVAEAIRRGIPVVVGVTPYVAGQTLQPLPEEATSLLTTLGQEGATIFDASAALEAAGGDVAGAYVDHVHFSERGHRIIGEALGRTLANMLADSTQVP